jgi:rRNA maturation endonuclease Nob1
MMLTTITSAFGMENFRCELQINLGTFVVQQVTSSISIFRKVINLCFVWFELSIADFRPICPVFIEFQPGQA